MDSDQVERAICGQQERDRRLSPSSRYRHAHDESDTAERYTVKGGSFADTRDGDTKVDRVQVRTSARKGFRPDYTAENLSFRCAQSMENAEVKDQKEFHVVRLRPPVHHHSNEPHEHTFHKDEF